VALIRTYNNILPFLPVSIDWSEAILIKGNAFNSYRSKLDDRIKIRSHLSNSHICNEGYLPVCKRAKNAFQFVFRTLPLHVSVSCEVFIIYRL
jgi:hypothetical protein